MASPDDSLLARLGANTKVGDVLWHIKTDNNLNHTVVSVVVKSVEHLFTDCYEIIVRGDGFEKKFTAAPNYVALYFDTQPDAETYLQQAVRTLK